MSLGNKEVLANNLKYYMDKYNVSRNDLVDDLDIAYMTVSDWVNAKTYPRIDKIEMLARYFQIEKSDLIEYHEKGDSSNKDTTPKNIDIVDSLIKIPVLGKIACGDPITADENVEEYRERPANDLPQGEVFYLQASGDSMEPSIPNGSYVLVRQQEEVENGEIAAVLVNDDSEATLKKYRKVNGVVLLEALNDSYDPYIVNENNSARILGKAIEVSYEL